MKNKELKKIKLSEGNIKQIKDNNNNYILWEI